MYEKTHEKWPKNCNFSLNSLFCPNFIVLGVKMADISEKKHGSPNFEKKKIKSLQFCIVQGSLNPNLTFLGEKL